MQAVVDHGRAHGLIVTAAVIADNEAALKLHLSLGFRPYGTGPKAMFRDGAFHDEALLVLGAT
ncbi:RimJ/RimL family protein N-acetyltransferase [Aminobacter sp. BE322]